MAFKPIDYNNVEEMAQRMGDIVERLPPYDRRELKLRDSSYFKLAIHPHQAMIEWILKEWIPKQPDKDALMELLALLRGKMLDFISFVIFGVKQWERIEAEGKQAE